MDSINDSTDHERGFTYVEGVISLAIWTMILPTLLLLLQSVLSGWRERVSEEELLRNFSQFQRDVRLETQQAKQWTAGADWISFSHDDLLVRYRWHQGKIVRNVKKHQQVHWQGTTVLLESTRRLQIRTTAAGVELTVWLQHEQAVFVGKTLLPMLQERKYGEK